jgi:hypothetical protein
VFAREPIDWDSFFEGYQSTLDSPSCKFYLELAEKYPAAKLILTLRDSTSWFESYKATILPMKSHPDGRQLLSFLFGGSFEERGAIIDAFERHNAEVQTLIPPERLLVYEVSQGWHPLCTFLEVPIPCAPFPRVNTRADFPAVLDKMLAKDQ